MTVLEDDFKRALRKAKRTNAPEDQWNLGFMYEKGSGVSRNVVTAVSWYRRAVEQG